MSPITEIDAITSLYNIFSDLQDPSARDRLLKWAWDKFATKTLPIPNQSIVDTNSSHTRTRKKVKVPAKTKSSSKAKVKLSIIKDLNLNPKGKKSFKDFAQEKQPKDNQEKCTVAVYYLRQELGLDNVSVNHIFTCYKNAGWRVANLHNVVALTASRKGWLDTSNMDDIAITTHGENLVEHDLPRQSKGKA